ncbi:hypothetical protein Emed_004898 [Eimeria media]
MAAATAAGADSSRPGTIGAAKNSSGSKAAMHELLPTSDHERQPRMQREESLNKERPTREDQMQIEQPTS